jgi:DNA polymerase sigma
MYNYTQPLVSHAGVAPSVMGPFVSVPMSVLPPRSKLHWDMCEFVSQLQTESNARLPAQMEAQRLCTATVQSLWPRAQVRPYGSYVTRLVLPSSDLDLVICLPKVRRDAPADTAGVLEGRNAIKETWQQNLARKLRQEPWVVPDSVKTLPHASVPIITLLTAPPYNVRLDISFEGPGHNGLATNDVVLSLIHEFPPLAPIMLVLKSFAIERGFAVAYSGGLSSYALLLMVARYLQEYNDTLPNGFENVSAAVQHSISAQSAADFGMMLMGFLDFYGNRFDPRTTGISVASRSFLNRESMSPTSSSSPSSALAPSMPVTATSDGPSHLHNSEDAGSTANVNGYSSTHWQNPPPPPSDLLSSPGSRRYGYRSSLDWPQNPASTGDIMTMMMHGEYYPPNTHVDPHKFDPVFIEDPLRPTNNVGRNCFRIMQIRRAFAAAHSSLLLASRSSSVFSENRSAVVSGVALHPDNLLRAILGASAPVNIKSEASGASSGDGTAAQTGASGPRQTPHSMRQNYMRFQQFAASASGVAPANGGGMLQYGDPQVAATHYFGGEHAYPVSQQELHPASHPHHYQFAATYRPNQHHQAHSSGGHHHQQAHHHHHVQPYMVDQSTGRMLSASSTYYYDYSPSHRGNDTAYRRYSESESERMTTRSVTSADQYERVSRRERSVGSPRRKTRATATSQRSLGAASSDGTLARDDHASSGRQHSSGGDTLPISTRKSPARSLSFADVVVGGGGGSNTTRRDSLHLAVLPRTNPTSPLALARQGRYWRDDSAINDSISEKWETKDDSQLK